MQTYADGKAHLHASGLFEYINLVIWGLECLHCFFYSPYSMDADAALFLCGYASRATMNKTLNQLKN